MSNYCTVTRYYYYYPLHILYNAHYTIILRPINNEGRGGQEKKGLTASSALLTVTSEL